MDGAAPILVYDQPKRGHFRRGAEVIAKVLDGRPMLKPISKVRAELARHRGTLVCQTADAYPLSFAFLCLWRSLFDRRTVGILIRDSYQASPLCWKYWIRRLMLNLTRCLPGVATLSFAVPEDEVSGDWVFDTEWWDLSVWPLLSNRRPRLNAGPSAVWFLGNFATHKGSLFFLEATKTAARLGAKLHFVIAGSTEAMDGDQRAGFLAAGGSILPAPPTDADFVASVADADWVWCCYHPASNKSSGIFGRALQLGRRSIVRKGAIIERSQKRYGCGISVDYGDVDGLLSALMGAPPADNKAPIDRFRDYSVDRLRRACGLDSRAVRSQ